MTTTTNSAISMNSAISADDHLLGQVLDEAIRRQSAGEAVDVEEYVRRYPELATTLRDLLSTSRILLDLGQMGTLGDFRLIRPLGRGGMGLVYEAEQISLQRRVALKVLLGAASLDDRHKTRFENEARAAASLDHPHIVPVYGVGCERGVPYYAMKLIEGLTIAQVSALSPHRAAEWGHQAAMALEHAHELGVIHRDIKPANLLLDAQEHLWVTDFGLARLASSGRESGGPLTHTGDVLGTLRYASPEQASGQTTLINVQTDVYSLGATLYELLTGRPAFDADNPEALLHQVLHTEPPPPRRVRPDIPVDLEVIVLKSLSKEPRDRYASMSALTEDLRRYLHDEPILARPPTPMQRLVKWGRRHRKPLWTTATTALATLLICLGFLLSAYRAKDAALTEAQTARDQAQASDQRSRHLITEVMIPLAKNALTSKEKLAILPAEQLASMVQAFDEVSTHDEIDDATRRVAVRVYGALSKLQQERQDFSGALSSLVKAFEVSQKIVETAPEDLGLRLQLSGLFDQSVHPLYQLGRKAEAEQAARRALAMVEELNGELPRRPVLLDVLANRLHSLASLMQRGGHWSEAELLLLRAVEVSRELTTLAPEKGSSWRNLALAYEKLTSNHRHTHRLPEAAIAASAAVDAGREALERTPDNAESQAARAEYERELAVYYRTLGKVFDQDGRLNEAAVAYKESARQMQTWAKTYPNFPGRQGNVSNTAFDWARCCEKRGASRETAQALHELLVFVRTETKDPVQETTRRNVLATLLATRPGASPADHQEAIDLARQDAEAAPQDSSRWALAAIIYGWAGREKEFEDALSRMKSQGYVNDGPEWNAELCFLRTRMKVRSGTLEAAREEYQKGLEYLKKEPLPSWGSYRAQVEAEKALGIRGN